MLKGGGIPSKRMLSDRPGIKVERNVCAAFAKFGRINEERKVRIRSAVTPHFAYVCMGSESVVAVVSLRLTGLCACFVREYSVSLLSKVFSYNYMVMYQQWLQDRSCPMDANRAAAPFEGVFKCA